MPDAELRDDLHATISLAWWAIVLILGAGLAAQAMGWLTFDVLKVSVLAVLILAASRVPVWCAPYVRRPLKIYLTAHLCNVILVTAVIHYAGGTMLAPAPLFYSLIVVNGGIVGTRPAYLFALASIAAYATLGTLELSGVLAPFPALDARESARQAHRFPGVVLIIGVALVVIAAYAARVATLVRERREKLLAANERHRRELEQRVEERTRALAAANRALDEKHRALRERNRSHRTFLHLITHDLKNPLNTIHLTADMVLRRDGALMPPRARDAVSRIHRMAEAAEGKILELMDLFRVISTPEPAAAVGLTELVTEVLDALQERCLAKRATIEVGTLPNIVGQREKLKHVLQNLLDNALKYVHAGRGQIRVHAEAAADMTILCVDDNGIGFPDGCGDSIFTLFWRAPPAYQVVDGQPVPGTGVGLALAKRVVEQHGGTITATCSPLGGARVEVRLPRAPGPASGRGPGEAQRVPVLVVDDNPGFCEVMVPLLEQGDPAFTVHAVETGHQSLAFLEHAAPYVDAPRPAFIVLDDHLPDGRAADMLERFAAVPECRSIPVLVLSTTAWPDDRAAALAAGAAAFEVKPSSLEALRDTVVAFWRHHALGPTDH